MSEEKKEAEQKIETKSDGSIVIPEHSEYCSCGGDSSLCCDNPDHPAYQGDEEQEESVAPTLVRQTNQLPLTDSEDDDFYDNNLAQPSMFAVHEGAAAQQRRLEMMRRVERRTSQHRHDSDDYSDGGGEVKDPFDYLLSTSSDSGDDEIQTQPDDNDEELERTHNEFGSQQHHRRLVAEKKAQLDQENPEYYEYKGFKVNLTRFLHGPDHKTSSWKRPLARMELHTAIDKIIKLKKEMLDANKAAKQDPNDRDKWIQVHTRAYALKVALAKINYNLDAYGGRIFDGHNRQYEGGQNGWRTIILNAREHLKKIHNPNYTMQPTTWLGGRTRRIRKRKTRKRKTRKRKTRKRKTRKKKKPHKKRKTRKKISRK